MFLKIIYFTLDTDKHIYLNYHAKLFDSKRKIEQALYEFET